MSEFYPLPDFLEFGILLTTLVPVDLLTHHSSLSHYWSLFTADFHAIYCFTIHSYILCIFLRRFYAILLRCFTFSSPGVFSSHFTRFLSHIATHFLHRDGRFCVFGFCTLHFSLLLVIGKLHVMWLTPHACENHSVYLVATKDSHTPSLIRH